MKKSEAYRKISECGILPTVFVYDLSDTVTLARTLYENGIRVIELLQRTPNALEAIRLVKERVPGMTVGAGTVLDPKGAERVFANGADYVVSPYYHQEIVDCCNEYDTAVIPGCATITEVSRGYDSGLRIFKYFPTNQLGGLDVIRQISEIYADARYVATGGITMEQLYEYSASKYICAVGSVCMMPQALIRAQDWAGIAALTRKAVAGSLGLSLIYDAGQGSAFNEELQLFESGRSDTGSVCGDFFTLGEQPARGMCTNSIERTLAHYADRGMRGEILRRDTDGTPVLADMLDEKTGTRTRLIARYIL